MMIEQELMIEINTLTTNTVYFSRAVELQKKDYCVLSKISAPRNYTLTGHNGLVTARFQLDVYASDYITAKTEAKKLYLLTDYTSLTVANIILANELDLYDNDTKLYRTVLDYIVNYYE